MKNSKRPSKDSPRPKRTDKPTNTSRPKRSDAPREDRPKRTFNSDDSRPKRSDAPREDRPKRTFNSDDSRPKRSDAPREDRPKRTFNSDDSRPKRSDAPREDRPKRTFNSDDSRPKRSDAPREERPKRSFNSTEFKKRTFDTDNSRDERPIRSFNPDAPREERPKRSFNSDDSRPKRSDAPREDHPKRTFKSDETRPKRSDAPREDRPKRTFNSDDSRPRRSDAPREDRPKRTFNSDDSRPKRSDAPREDRPKRTPENDTRPKRAVPRRDSESPKFDFDPNDSTDERPVRSTNPDADNRPKRSEKLGRDARPRAKGGAVKPKQSANFNMNEKGIFKPFIGKVNAADDDDMRLNKYVANCGLAARRKAGEMILAGEITVNGKVVAEPGYRVLPQDVVKHKGKELKPVEKKIYLLMNKPKDTITTVSDEKGRKTVIDLVKRTVKERIFPVGRLDRDTTGLLLLTNDGDLAQTMAHPSYRIKKLYHVVLDKPLTKSDLTGIANGVELEDGLAEVDGVQYVSGTSKDEVMIEIHIGKNRIVRRIFEHLGYQVTRLDRVYYGGLTKKDLPRAGYRTLTDREIIMLKHFTGK